MSTFTLRSGVTGIGLLALMLALLSPTAAAQAGEQDILPEWQDAGVIDVGEYDSPTFGYSVEWDDTWLIDEFFGDGAVVSQSDPILFDSIALPHADRSRHVGVEIGARGPAVIVELI